MIKLTGIFKINKRIGSMVEIVKEINGEKVYILVNEKKVKINENGIHVDNKEVSRLSWFFKTMKTVF